VFSAGSVKIGPKGYSFGGAFVPAGGLAARGLVVIVRVVAVQTPSSPFLPEPATRKHTTASENCPGSVSFLILVVELILTFCSGVLVVALRVRTMLVVSMLATVPP